jgi:DNA invertase Pin-like site-specific DNA recombinase
MRVSATALSLHEKLDTATPGAMFVFHVFVALAGFIRTIIVANQNEGLAAARAAGQRLGRPPAMTPEKVAYALQLLGEPDCTMTSIATLLGVSRSTLCTSLPELQAAKRNRRGLDDSLARLRPDSRPGPPTVDQYDALLCLAGR